MNIIAAAAAAAIILVVGIVWTAHAITALVISTVEARDRIIEAAQKRRDRIRARRQRSTLHAVTRYSSLQPRRVRAFLHGYRLALEASEALSLLDHAVTSASTPERVAQQNDKAMATATEFYRWQQRDSVLMSRALEALADELARLLLDAPSQELADSPELSGPGREAFAAWWRSHDSEVYPLLRRFEDSVRAAIGTGARERAG